MIGAPDRLPSVRQSGKPIHRETSESTITDMRVFNKRLEAREISSHLCLGRSVCLSVCLSVTLIFSTNLFVRSSSTFPSTGLTPLTQVFFIFLGHVGFNFGIVC